MRTRRRAIDDLRVAVGCLPRATREAMLDGLERNRIIVGAYSTVDGICPMLAAHRAGGRTNFIAFADAWDRFAGRTGWRGRARPAARRELLVLRAHLEASLLADEAEPAGGLAGAIVEHRALVARRRPRPGDRDRSRELCGRTGWAWSRLFRRYDDYAEAVTTFSREGQPAAADAPSPV
jgi:hypothetical protein